MTTIEFKLGERVWWKKQSVTIKAVLSLDTVLVVTADGRSETAPISELVASPLMDSTVIQKPHDLANIDFKDWKEAERRAGVIGELDAMGRPGRFAIEEAATKLGLGKTQVYELLTRWRDGGGVASALLPHRSGPQSGAVRISEEHRAVIESAIEAIIKKHSRVKVSKIVEEANLRFFRAGLKPPSPTTIRKVFLERDMKTIVRATRGKNAASKLDAVPGKYPETQFPLQVIQIDHTVADVMVVDEVNRKPIQRPWLTLAIDVNTRMVTGFLLSLDPPSSASVALCLTHSVLPKEDWLARRGLSEVKWPVWGKPNTIHVDNGKDFRAEPLKLGAEEHRITIIFRPVKTPRYGGHIERLIGTIMADVHMLPGTTFSNTKEKAEYDSEKTACMTISELERWLTLNIAVYHGTVHSSLGVPPLTAWEAGILGTETMPGRGLPPRITEPERFLLDFLPLKRRTIHRDGILLDHIKYWSDVLTPHIGSGGTSVVRYDPRDLSRVWVRLGAEYYALGYTSRFRPPISQWEYSEARRRLKEAGRKAVDEDAIFGMIEEMRRIVDAAAATTKSARRASERKRHTERMVKETRDSVSPASSSSAPAGLGDVERPPSEPSEESGQQKQPPNPFEVEEW